MIAMMMMVIAGFGAADAPRTVAPADPPNAGVHKAVAVDAAFLASLPRGGGGVAGHDFDIDWSSLDSGGGVSAVDGYELHGTTGQPDTASLAAADFVLTGGFWAAEGGPRPPCAADCDGDLALTIDDFICFQVSFAVGCG